MIVKKNQLFVQFNDIAWDDLGEGIRRKVMTYGDAIMGIYVEFMAGAVGKMHSHPHVQFSYIQSGSFKVHIGDETMVLRAGDFYFVPSDVVHGVECLEDAILLDAFTPVRADLIPNNSSPA